MDDRKIKIQQVIDPHLKENYITIHAQTAPQAQVLAQQISPCLTQNQEDIALKVDDQYFILHTKEILYLEVNQGVLTITTNTGKYQTRQSLASLADMLSSQDFIRISKYAMVRIQAIERLEMAFSGNMYAYLRTGQRVNVSRRFVNSLKARLGI
ncbi:MULTISPECIES: LytTR family DNA-binding domain-containing protein [Aerococcus]|uniref:LytTR family DNA-binding domain-containing protein n=1 Tax=Aerococcus TaxID=1375 RepID=UPI000DCE047B|nr:MULTISPECIES: LytTR family DNA-binding domain-containing protein [Aerococcus]KAA9233668.1 LytTR family transcriptional regulator [Aerococcus mictus]MDK6375373.1 LytTR family DNA-binding domain-containing protein [Aerococcus urinae]MDK6420858.1 LytTR family DNA-binding domain-containing protein [Aerococcus urinae]MDK8075714.1 LytTR family DNA-binding domain-containing protein [Aerococcus urinae]MDK8084517.1 LytTR family DNA-binding domain-containing protein [Aerococcus urinae]